MILAESAKYDVSCASSGTSRSHKAGNIGSAARLGHLPQLRRGRTLHFIVKNHAHQSLYVRLCLLYQPPQQ